MTAPTTPVATGESMLVSARRELFGTVEKFRNNPDPDIRIGCAYTALEIPLSTAQLWGAGMLVEAARDPEFSFAEKRDLLWKSRTINTGVVRNGRHPELTGEAAMASIELATSPMVEWMVLTGELPPEKVTKYCYSSLVEACEMIIQRFAWENRGDLESRHYGAASRASVLLLLMRHGASRAPQEPRYVATPSFLLDELGRDPDASKSLRWNVSGFTQESGASEPTLTHRVRAKSAQGTKAKKPAAPGVARIYVHDDLRLEDGRIRPTTIMRECWIDQNNPGHQDVTERLGQREQRLLGLLSDAKE